MFKSIISILLFAQLVSAQVVNRNPVPSNIEAEALAAVKVLCTEMLKENYSYAFEKLYPRTKKKLAFAMGGDAELKKVFDGIPLKMKAQGIDIIDIEVKKPTQSLEVLAAHLTDSTKPPVFTEYMVIVPIVKTLRIIDPQSGVVKKAKAYGYQIAVRHMDEASWTFIDGTTLSLRQLRDLFPHLPESAAELKIPQTGLKEIK